MDTNVPASLPPGSRGTLTSERAGVPEQPPDWGRTPGAKPRSSRKTVTDDDDDDDDEPGDENSFRAIAAEFFQSTKAEIVDMMAEQAAEIRTTKDLVNQLLTALNDLKNARGRSGSRDSTRSSQRPMSEHAREQRRAEKQPIVEVKPAIAVPTSEPLVSLKPSLSAAAMMGAQSPNDPAGFRGHFDAIPTDLYRMGGYAFTMRDFLAAQAVIEVPRRELEEQGRWRARAFHAYATEAQKQAKARDVAAARDMSAVPRTSTETPIRDIPQHMHVLRPTPTREDWGLTRHPSLPKSAYAAPLNHRDDRQQAPSPFAEPVSAMRSTPVRLAPQETQFTEAQYRNLYGPGVDPMDQRLLLALYTFENKHFTERLPPKVNGVKMEPPTYTGTGEIASLENFLIKFFKWQMVHGLTDSLGFSKALEVMGLCLKGSAETWYATECTIHAETGNEWTFESLIVGLRQRFVHATAKADAKAAYDAIRLGPEGVMELDSQLSRAAGYLVEKPSDYDRRLRFMSALPFAMSQRMLQDGHTAEKSTLAQLVAKAVDIESAAKASAAVRGRASTGHVAATHGTDSREPPERRGGDQYRGYGHRDQAPERVRFRDQPRDWEWNRQHDKPLPPTPSAANGVNKPFATPPARPGSTFTPRTDTSRSVRGNAAAVRVEPESDAAKSTAPPTVDAVGASDDIEPNDDDYHQEVTALDEEPGGREEYNGLGYDERDITGFEMEPDEWLAGENDEYLYERVAWTRMARIVDVENTVHAAGAVAKPAVVYRHASRPARSHDDQPVRTAGQRLFFEGIVQLGTLSAHVLVDTGTDTDMVSAEYARAAKLRTFQLHRPVSLQMACVGSRSRIIFGAKADVRIGELVVKERYFDVANVDKYDAILGLPFLWATAATIRFQGAGVLQINGQSFDLLESDFAVKRKLSSRDQTARAAAPTTQRSAAVPPVDPRTLTARMGRIRFVDDSTVVADCLSTTDEPCKPQPMYKSAQQSDPDCNVCERAVSTDCTAQKSLFTSAGVQESDGGLLNGTTFSRSNQNDWFDKIPMVNFVLNSSTNTTTGLAPFETVYGYKPQMLSSLSIFTPSDLAISMDGETGVTDPNATLPSTVLVRPGDPELRTDTDAALEDTRREQWETEKREARESKDGHH